MAGCAPCSTPPADPGVTYAVDPALVEELETMRRGYQVLGPRDTVTTGTGSVVAARWLDDFARLRARGDGYRTAVRRVRT